MSLSVTSANPLSQSLLDPAGTGQTGGPAGGQRAGADGSSNQNAVSIGQNGALDLSAVDTVALNLNRATAIADVAIGAGQSVAGLLTQLKAQATSAEDSSLDPTARQGLNDTFKALLGQIGQTVAQASFDGVNLVNGQAATGLNLQTGPGGPAALTLASQDLSLGGPVVTLETTASLGTPDAAASALGGVDASLSNLEQALTALTDQANQIVSHGAIVNRLSGALRAQTQASGQRQQRWGAAAGAPDPAGVEHPAATDRQPGAAAGFVVVPLARRVHPALLEGE